MKITDIILVKNTFFEAAVGMSAGEITKYKDRVAKFINKIKLGEPFTTTDNQEVTLDPAEAKRFADLYANNLFKGALKARTVDGTEIPISKLAKTAEFGGAAVAIGQDPSTAGKEALIVKPSQIGICDKNIPAGNLHQEISKNTVLLSTDYGRVVTQFADAIASGNPVQFPPEYLSKDKEKIRKAIVDYAGEYLGVLALLHGQSNFPRREDFIEWLGGEVNQLYLNFPSKANTNIADSYAQITNPKTAHRLNISSKGTGGGAAPAISGLKIGDEIKRNTKLKNAVQFIELCQSTGTVEQAFAAMDLIYSISPKSISKQFHKFLPFSSKASGLSALAKESVKTKAPLPEKFRSMYADIKASKEATEAGTLIYAIKKDVAIAINEKNAIPEFKDTILQVLEMNFVQQYADYKRGTITFETQWPAKLHGDISVVNKSSSVDPTAGGFSFKLGRVAEYDDQSNPGAARDANDPKPKRSNTDIDKKISDIASRKSSLTLKPKSSRAREKRDIEPKKPRSRR